MKKFFILFLILFTACSPSEDEIKAQVDLAVETALSDATSTTTTLAPTTSTTTLAPTTSTTKPKNVSSSSQNSICRAWATATASNLSTYQSISSSISSDSYDAAYGFITFYAYQKNLESYERRLISLENSQIKLSPNSANITSHNHILDAISTSISVVSFTILGLESDDPSYIEFAADLQALATQSINSSTRTLKDC